MDRRNLTLDIKAANIGAKRVNVRSSLTVENLTATSKDKFNLDGEFRLTRQGASEPLAAEAPLDHAGVEEDSTLLCVRVTEATGTLDAIRGGERHGFSKAFKRVWLGGGRTPAGDGLAGEPGGQ